MQGTRVRALVREDPTCRGATRPVCHSYWACALEPVSHNYWAHVPQLLSPRATTTEARSPRACAPQQEKPPQGEARALQRRVAPARHNQRKPASNNKDPTQPKINKLINFKNNNKIKYTEVREGRKEGRGKGHSQLLWDNIQFFCCWADFFSRNSPKE